MDGETEYEPYSVKVTLEPETVCMTTITSEELTGAWDLTEW